MVAVVLTKSWDQGAFSVDTENIASAEEIPGENFGALVHLFKAVGIVSVGTQYNVKDIPVLETPAQIASIRNQVLRGLA